MKSTLTLLMMMMLATSTMLASMTSAASTLRGLNVQQQEEDSTWKDITVTPQLSTLLVTGLSNATNYDPAINRDAYICARSISTVQEQVNQKEGSTRYLAKGRACTLRRDFYHWGCNDPMCTQFDFTATVVSKPDSEDKPFFIEAINWKMD